MPFKLLSNVGTGVFKPNGKIPSRYNVNPQGEIILTDELVVAMGLERIPPIRGMEHFVTGRYDFYRLGEQFYIAEKTAEGNILRASFNTRGEQR